MRTSRRRRRMCSASTLGALDHWDSTKSKAKMGVCMAKLQKALGGPWWVSLVDPSEFWELSAQD